MSVTKETTIWCDGTTDDGGLCTQWSTVPTPRQDNARSELRHYGWVYQNKQDLCPACAALAQRNKED